MRAGTRRSAICCRVRSSPRCATTAAADDRNGPATQIRVIGARDRDVPLHIPVDDFPYVAMALQSAGPHQNAALGRVWYDI
jgi:hypothetical protein